MMVRMLLAAMPDPAEKPSTSVPEAQTSPSASQDAAHHRTHCAIHDCVSSFRTLSPGTHVTTSFPEGATLAATFPASAIVDDQVMLAWKTRHADVQSITPARIEMSSDSEVTAVAVLDLQLNFVPAGTAIDYEWHTGSGPLVSMGTPDSFDWFDQRWEWRSISQDSITVWTYGDETAAAPDILSSASAVLHRMQDDYDIQLDHPISIWAYASSSDFSGTRQPNSREAVAAVSYPVHGIVAAVLPAGQPAEVDRVIPHEMSHLVLAQATANPWNHPPLWFDEGLAVYLQSGGTLPYEMILHRVSGEGTFFRLDAIAWTFPFSAEAASRAYAQGWSVVAWMHETYGVDGVARLIHAFGTGVSWDEAIQDALGTTQAELERDWHAWLDQNPPPLDARLFETFARIVKPGSIASSMTKPEQEYTVWPSILADRNAQRSSTRLRSSESWR